MAKKRPTDEQPSPPNIYDAKVIRTPGTRGLLVESVDGFLQLTCIEDGSAFRIGPQGTIALRHLIDQWLAWTGDLSMAE